MPSLWVTGPNGLIPLEAEGYASEKEFQALLAASPEVLASALDQAATDPRWLLVDRELPIRADEEGGTRWSLDHLFIAPDGVPVLVEVKRSSDPRARREVVAQMLDYAASFAIDWSAERLRGRWQARLARDRVDGAQEIDGFLETSPFDDEGRLWSEVQTKIEAGRIRLLFVADRLSPTLVRIIEYLNEQLKTTEVLGVEVVRHADAESQHVAYEPVVRGRTAAVSASKSAPERRTEAEFESVLAVHHGPEVLAAVQQLVARAKAMDDFGFVSVGTGAASPRLFLNFKTKGTGRTYWPIAINPRPGKLVLFLRYLKHHPAFEDEAVRAEFADRMGKAVGQEVQGDNLGGFPWLPIGCLVEPGVVDEVGEVLEWVIATANEDGQ